MIQYKRGVIFENMHPYIYNAIPRIELIIKKYGVPLVITSGKDGIHIKDSLHYYGRAVDIRTRQIDVSNRNIFADKVLRTLLDVHEGYDVLLKPTHLHVEFNFGRSHANETT